jgi:hypothetical protein
VAFIAFSFCCASETAAASGILLGEKSFIGYLPAAFAASYSSSTKIARASPEPFILFPAR